MKIGILPGFLLFLSVISAMETLQAAPRFSAARMRQQAHADMPGAVPDAPCVGGEEALTTSARQSAAAGKAGEASAAFNDETNGHTVPQPDTSGTPEADTSPSDLTPTTIPTANEPTDHALAAAAPVRLRRLQHQVSAEFRPEYICPTNPFLEGINKAGRTIDRSFAAHLRYSFRYRPGSRPDRIYGGAYQGIGVSYFNFGNRQELGDPVAFYLFQGARIARISPRLSFNYEWNFGLSFGWQPYHPYANSANIMMGSKMNAYLNADFYLSWAMSRRFDLTAGLSMTHFSNGNTKYPNAGLNSVGMKIGLLYNFGTGENPLAKPHRPLFTPEFPRHFSYDLVLFGSWRRKGVAIGDKQYASPDVYGVAGVNFAAMYNFGYKFRAGVSLDAVYDGSANVYTEDYIVGGGYDPGYTFYTPALSKQLALGLSARAEYVMPYFTVGIGLGVNALHKGGDLKAFYQMLTLKVAMTRSSFVHIGYCLKDFQTPNFLMLGFGYRFNNKYPVLR